MPAPDDHGRKAGVFFAPCEGRLGYSPADESGRPELPVQDNYHVAETQAREALAKLDPAVQAARCGAAQDAGRGEISLRFFDREFAVGFPGGQVRALNGADVPIWERVIALHYLGSQDVLPPAGEPSAKAPRAANSAPSAKTPRTADNALIDFLQVPAGGFYFDAFRRRAHEPLASFFGDRPQLLVRAGESLGGTRFDLGDAAVRLPVLPRLAVVAVVHAVDEEFPAEAKLLFEPIILDFFCTEDIAVIGGMVSGRLIQAARRLQSGEST